MQQSPALQIGDVHLLPVNVYLSADRSYTPGIVRKGTPFRRHIRDLPGRSVPVRLGWHDATSSTLALTSPAYAAACHRYTMDSVSACWHYHPGTHWLLRLNQLFCTSHDQHQHPLLPRLHSAGCVHEPLDGVIGSRRYAGRNEVTADQDGAAASLLKYTAWKIGQHLQGAKHHDQRNQYRGGGNRLHDTLYLLYAGIHPQPSVQAENVIDNWFDDQACQ